MAYPFGKSEIAIFDLIDYDKIDAVVTFDERIFRKDILENIRRNAAVHGKPVISVGDSHDDCTSVMFDYEKALNRWCAISSSSTALAMLR